MYTYEHPEFQLAETIRHLNEATAKSIKEILEAMIKQENKIAELERRIEQLEKGRR